MKVYTVHMYLLNYYQREFTNAFYKTYACNAVARTRRASYL
jgi:hypothetical protein